MTALAVAQPADMHPTVMPVRIAQTVTRAATAWEAYTQGGVCQAKQRVTAGSPPLESVPPASRHVVSMSSAVLDTSAAATVANTTGRNGIGKQNTSSHGMHTHDHIQQVIGLCGINC